MYEDKINLWQVEGSEGEDFEGKKRWLSDTAGLSGVEREASDAVRPGLGVVP